MAPVAPVGPAGPIGPVAPVAPVAPLAPVAPVAPVGPVGPVGKGLPTQVPVASITGMLPMETVVGWMSPRTSPASIA
jgi:hypothetical protein